jgi:tyrosine-protein phosphatase SIW14
MGIRTIVNLERSFFRRETCAVKKEKKWAGDFGIRIAEVPVRPLFTPDRNTMDRIIAFIADPGNQPVFIHCNLGKDRTGIVVAAYRMKIQGWKPGDAYKEMVKNGFNRILFWFKSFLFDYYRSLTQKP